MFKSFSYGVYVAFLKPLVTEFNSPFSSFLLRSISCHFEAFSYGVWVVMFKSFSYGVYVAFLKPLVTEFNSPFSSFLLRSISCHFEAFSYGVYLSRRFEAFIDGV